MLRQDSLYRGRHAIHVHGHRKLGRHKTLLKVALPLIDAIIGMSEVDQVAFGKIYSGYSRQDGVWVKEEGATLKLSVATWRRMQIFQIFPRSNSGVPNIRYALQVAAEQQRLQWRH